MNPPNDPIHQGKAPPRPSAACLRCRSRHLKCDGSKPACNRCALTTADCTYAPSRRGGLDRAALAERRKRLAEEGERLSKDGTKPKTSRQQQARVDGRGPALDAFLRDGSELRISKEARAQSRGLEDDTLIDAYYTSFHPLHPFLVPRSYFPRLCHDQGEQPAVKALTGVMHLVGNIYASRSWSPELKNHVDENLSRERLDDPFMAQARLLYSVALFWQGYQEEAKVQLELAVSIALSLGMSRQEFATTHRAGDPVLAESWRRTWWSMYIVSAYHAGTLGTLNFTVMEVNATVDLPCEELEYETGVSPMSSSEPSLSLHAEGYSSAQDAGRL